MSENNEDVKSEEAAPFPLFTGLPTMCVLGNYGMKLRLSEDAELARLEPLQYQLEGPRVNAGSARERMLHHPDRE